MISWIRKVRRTIRDDSEYRLGRYGTFRGRFALSGWRWTASLCLFEEGWSLHLFCLWVKLGRASREPHEIMESWGIQYDPEFRSVHLNWGKHCKILYMPHSFDHHRMWVMLRDGSFLSYEPYNSQRKDKAGRWMIERKPEPTDLYRETFSYVYTLKSGEVQVREATVTVERREWCWRARPFRWLRRPRKVRTSIDVKFSAEVGERTGSWKGGTVGCGWDLRPGETPEQSLRRMEREREF